MADREKITLWIKMYKKFGATVGKFNHIEKGHSTEMRPKGTLEQNLIWDKCQWIKQFAYFDEKQKVVYE